MTFSACSTFLVARINNVLLASPTVIYESLNMIGSHKIQLPPSNPCLPWQDLSWVIISCFDHLKDVWSQVERIDSHTSNNNINIVKCQLLHEQFKALAYTYTDTYWARAHSNTKTWMGLTFYNYKVNCTARERKRYEFIPWHPSRRVHEK